MRGRGGGGGPLIFHESWDQFYPQSFTLLQHSDVSKEGAAKQTGGETSPDRKKNVKRNVSVVLNAYDLLDSGWASEVKDWEGPSLKIVKKRVFEQILRWIADQVSRKKKRVFGPQILRWIADQVELKRVFEQIRRWIADQVECLRRSLSSLSCSQNILFIPSPKTF